MIKEILNSIPIEIQYILGIIFLSFLSYCIIILLIKINKKDGEH